MTSFDISLPGTFRRAGRSLGRSLQLSIVSGAAAMALVALSSAAQAKPLRGFSSVQAGSGASGSRSSGGSSISGRLTSQVLAELRSNRGESKSILVRNRIEWCGTTRSYYRRHPQEALLSAMSGTCVVQGLPDTPAIRNAAIPTASAPWKTIRVLFHIFTKDDGSAPTSTAADVQGALNQLNADYAPGRIRFVSTGLLTHASTRFRQPPKFANDDAQGAFINAMKTSYAVAPARQLNTFVIEAETMDPTLLGEGTLPWDSDALTATGGFFCDNNAFGAGKRTATHEFGHCLGLWHPFHGTEEVQLDGCGGCREVVGRTPAEGDVTGDFCSDTPPTSRNFNCGAPVDNPDTPANEAVDSCTGKPFGATDFSNYMGYADDSCINHFTAQQSGRMRAWIDYKLKSWQIGLSPNEPPVVESTAPAGRVLSRLPLIGASFTQPMNKATVQAALRIVPAVRGSFVWAADAKSFSLRPSAALSTGTTYRVQILPSAKDIKGRALDGNYNGRAESAAIDTVSWSFRVAGAPANDRFSNAQVLGASGALEGSNEEATKEPGEPNHASERGGASVWYRYVAPAAGIAAFSTQGSGFDTLLAAYQGTAVGALTELASNDDLGDGDLASAIRFHVSRGDVVWVAVDGVRDDSGTPAQGRIALGWGLTIAPANDLFANAATIGGARGSAVGNNEGAWSEEGEVGPAFNSPQSSIWYRWTAPASGLATFDTEGSAFDTAIGVYVGTSVGALTAIASDEDSGSGSLSRVSFTAVAGATYSISIVGQGPGVGAPRGAAKLSWSLLAAPSNDLFANAQVLAGPSGSVSGTNVGANVEDGEPSHAFSRYASVWYRYQAPANGTLAFSTQNSALDTVLAVYSGPSVNALAKIAENDDAGSGVTWSYVSFQATAGQVYSIAVDSSSSSDRGALALNWGFTPAPPNDLFALRQVLEGASGQVVGTNNGAGAEPNEAGPVNYTAVASVWYQWTAPATGSATFSTAGSSFDTTLGAYIAAGDGVEKVAANDDDGALKTSAITFDAVAGTAYFITVDSYNNGSQTVRGGIVLSWSLAASAPATRLQPAPPSVRRSDASPARLQPGLLRPVVLRAGG